MIPGKVKIYFFSLLFLLSSISLTNSEDKISTSPLINLEELKPSYEEVTEEVNKSENKEVLKKKSIVKNESKVVTVNLLGLDKITAKTSEIKLEIGETKKFGMLEIKALKCGAVNYFDKTESAAYIQVKDISKNQNEKIFIFNGWTFSTDQQISPIEHAIYDLWLTGCDNV
tara:strand:- start:116 stop:628 length:513 start_codon:yes stop_codon:yes gene_type:complete